MNTISLVTGANRGIGREACRQLADLGHTVVLTARDAHAASAAGPPAYTASKIAGAGGVVWAATLPDAGPTGGFFRDGRPLPW